MSEETTPAAEGQAAQEPAPPTATAAPTNAKKKDRKKSSFGQRLRNLTKIRISVRVGDEEPQPAPAAPAEAATTETPAPSAGDVLFGAAQEAKPEKPEEKKDKRKAKNKKKAPRKKAKKPSKKAKAAQDDTGNRRRVVVAVCLLLALIAVGTGVYAAVALSNKVGSPEDMLKRAEKLTGQGKYDQAISLYGQVIDEGALAADAYLGLADTFETAEDPESALTRLEVGYLDTGDERLLDRYEEIAGVRPALSPEMLDGDGVVAVPANQPIQWQDPAFEAMVRRAMNIPAGQDIYESDLSAVTSLRILGGSHAVVAQGEDSAGLANRNDVDSYEVDGITYTERGEITSLADVVHFQNLTRLTVAYNRVESIDGVQKLTRLRTLSLYANEIEDLSPLEGMTGLRWLYLFNNKISDLSPLASLSSLEGVSMQYNAISDLSPLAGLSNLEELFLSHNRIADIAPLAGLGNLRFLYMQDNLVTDISPVADMGALTDINFTDNPVSDYAPASRVRNVNKTSTFVNG